jgi:phosphoheptose isomerase
MTTATLAPPTLDRPIQAPRLVASLITRVQDAVSALPAPALPQDTVVATTVGNLASTHIIDARTLAVVTRKDRHIQPIAAMITEHLLGVTATVVGSAIIVTLT